MLVVGGESVPVRFFWSWDSALSELSAAVKFLFFRFISRDCYIIPPVGFSVLSVQRGIAHAA